MCKKENKKIIFILFCFLFFCLLTEITVILNTLNELIYISLETNRRILDRAVLEHQIIDVGRNSLYKNELLGLSHLIMRVDVAKKVQKNTGMTKSATRNCRNKKSPLFVLLHLKESLVRNLCAILVKEEMLPGVPVAHGTEILILFTIETIKTAVLNHLVPTPLTRVNLALTAIEDLLILPQGKTKLTFHECGIVVRLERESAIA